MRYGIVFSDVDGTLLDSRHRLPVNTLRSIRALAQQKIPFVIISARSPSGIRPIQEEYGFRCPIICYSGALILDEDGQVLFSTGFPAETARQIIGFIEDKRLGCTWNLYSTDTWIVKDRQDPRVMREELIVRAKATEGTADMLPDGAAVGKILCMCDPERLCETEEKIKAAFPSLSVVRSSDILLEIMQEGVTKSSAVKRLCGLWQIPVECAVAFGDHYNDEEMLKTVGMPWLMGNAPDELKSRFANITDSNDEDGLYHGLLKLGLVPRFAEDGRRDG